MRRDLQQTAALRDGEDDDLPDPPQLRALRGLVTLLTVTMIVGIAVVAGTLVYRVMKQPAPTDFTEIAVESGLSVIRVDHSQPDRLVLVLRGADGLEIVRVYRTISGAAPRYDGPVTAQ